MIKFSVDISISKDQSSQFSKLYHLKCKIIMNNIYRVMSIPEERIISAKIKQDEPKAKTVEIQTIFRESEAQTDPYTPEYVEDHTNGIPEVLGIKDLVYGRGLPASKTEMELIS
jgi:hypothetical protein